MEGDRSFAFSTAINNDSKVTTSTLGVAHPMEACLSAIDTTIRLVGN